MWIITKDYVSDEGDVLNRTGKHSRDYNSERFALADKLEIRLFDDDGELYYDALATRERIEGTEERAFALLDWAMADAGCTELQYFDKGEWHTL